MNDMFVNLTRSTLASKATSIGKPASAPMISAFERKYGIVMCPGLRSFYMICNGLVSAGKFLTSIREIELVEPVFVGNADTSYFLFGDIMLQSDDLATDFSDPMSPVMLVGAKQALTSNFNALLKELIA